MKSYIFTVDDNIRFLAECARGEYSSIFSHPYMQTYRRLHEKYGVKVQLNLFYECEGFNLSDMPDSFKEELADASDWLKMSFHSRLENVKPYEESDYSEVYRDASRVHNEIKRFAGDSSLAKTTTVHYCRTTEEGRRALSELGILGLLGLFGTEDNPRSSYSLSEVLAERARRGETVDCDGVKYASIDLILNNLDIEKIPTALDSLAARECVRIMIHEQYFYPDYPRYQPNFEEKLELAFRLLSERGYKSAFFEDIIL
jgi:hypothetical protein